MRRLLPVESARRPIRGDPPVARFAPRTRRRRRTTERKVRMPLSEPPSPTPPSRPRRPVVVGALAVVIVAMLALLAAVLAGHDRVHDVAHPRCEAPAVREPVGQRRQRRHVGGDTARDDPGGAGEGGPGHRRQPRPGRVPRAADDRPRRRSRRADHDQGPGDRDGPGGPLQGGGLRDRPHLQHRPQLDHASRASRSTGRSSWRPRRSRPTCARSTRSSRASRTASRTAG